MWDISDEIKCNCINNVNKRIKKKNNEEQANDSM